MPKRILIVGHGIAGTTLARDVERHGDHVVGFLDDLSTDERVVGALADVNTVIHQLDVESVYFAIPSVESKIVREFINTIDTDTVDIAIVPRNYGIIEKETVDINDLTDVDVLDLVGRQPVKHDLIAAREFIRGKRVMVTGAAGSIGSRLVKQVLGMEPESVVCVDWWENGMFFLSQELADASNITFRIADVKNERSMERVFATQKPDIVFHAAAYKHVPLMQDNALEAVNNNVWGSLNVMRLAVRHDARNVVYVSTDKAVNPVNVMGTTKRLGEMIMESLAGAAPRTRFNAVRFGNVIQSNGSVMQIFRDQIAKRQPLTVTDPDVTRFFMTVDEASQLIIQSALVGKDSEIFVLDMGEPIKIMDLAKSLINAVDPSLEIITTGLRPGEKMYEELSYEPDKVDRTDNTKIFVLKNEKHFDTAAYMGWVENLIARTLKYELSDADLIAELRDNGFAIR